ncbi:hypothetical protein JZ751_000334 [Albula glossodonta]|uniref:Rho family-interacting cell polarization regulator 2 n=1 Tax=Albula glossodonta TaxID=121402 RepID=A0A8T2PWA1_9TELE|nr:hypothetical protein JZ751_000334 [Albula glossodonta]
MAAGTHSPGGPTGIIRSQSFAGFSTLQERRSRCNSFMGNSAVQKKPQSKPKKTHVSGHKSSSSSTREPQPKRVEEVYCALKQGLDEYLEVHQTELDKLTSLMKDMKRNSRLGVLYDLDKQIKSIERYVRRLEFHISKVDELYEAFCIQRRLRDGAFKMKQAFSASPSTKGTRESIFMRYGRQRWKLKGKIEVNSRQSWDGEEMVFMPLITDLINIKVTELKGLATHILVGSVICETKDLFTAMPQVVAVDVNDLGTIKLNLEVTWFPFDVEDLTLSSGNLSKATALQRRVSIYSQGTPETPTFQDTSFFKWQLRPQDRQRPSFLRALRSTFLEKLGRSRSFGDLASLRPRPKSSLEVYSVLPDDVFENGGCGAPECKRLSFNFTDTPQSSPTPVQSNPEITVTPPESDRQSRPPPRAGEGRLPAEGEEEPDQEGAEVASVSLASEGEAETEAESEWDQNGSPSQCSDQMSTVAPEDVFLDHSVSDTLLPDEASELKPVELDTDEGSLTKQLVKRLTSADMMPEGALSWEGGRGSMLESSLEEAIQNLLLRLEGLGDKCREIQELEQEVMRLEDLLKCRAPAHRSRSSSLSLTVESALESFDFLNTSDFDDEDTGEDALPRSMFFDMESERIGPGQHPEARGHLSEALTEDTGVGNSVAGSPLPLTTGNESLDIAIIIHLLYCSHLIQLVSTGGSPSPHKARLLLKVSSQTQLLEELGEISTDRLGSVASAADVLPGLADKPSLLSLWSACTGSGSLFHTTVDRVLKHMDRSFSATLQASRIHTADSVIRQLVSEMMDRCEPASPPCSTPSTLSQNILTVFQFHSYTSAHSVSDMKEHLLQLAQEAVFTEGLCSGDSERAIRELEEVAASSLRPHPDTLRALAMLLTTDDPQLSKAASTFITSASAHQPFRSKAVEWYTEALSEAGLETQRGACTALSCLQACESIEALVSLCDSADEDLRHVAIETLLTLGEEGRLAYEQLDTVPREMVRLGTRRGNAVTTAF